MESDEIKANVGHARALARKIIVDSKLSTAPILISSVLTYLQGKNYEISVYAWKFDESVSGIQLAGNATSCVIGYNEDQHVHRQRLTVAHEIGHFLLGHTREFDPDKFKPSEIQEKEAYEFAGELLMPLAMLKASIKNGRKSLDLLARDYYVSKEAITMRLMKANLLNKL
jgi:Zn-dependent peptidase ImmA (M78 family)